MELSWLLTISSKTDLLFPILQRKVAEIQVHIKWLRSYPM